MRKTVSALLCALMLAGSYGCADRDQYIILSGYAQGGTYSVKLNLKGRDGRVRKSPEAIKAAVDSILYAIDTTLSGYNKSSQLSRLNAGKAVSINRKGIFPDIYARSYRYYEETGGALDVAAGPLFDIWGFGFTSDSLPSKSIIDSVMADCGMGRLKPEVPLPYEGNSIKGTDLLSDGSSEVPPVLNFNAVAQGYSCDLVATYLYSIGVKDMLVDIGEIYCDGLNPAGKPWKVGIDRPVDGNNVPGADLDGVWESSGGPCGIVTSGNYRKFYIRNGHKYSHTLDPRTGHPVEHNLLSATIVASNATDADAYATYCMVIGFEEARMFIEKNSQRLSGYLIYSDEEGNMKEWASDGFSIVNQ
ncbi:MAG: FAD:protein FMN transferase [Bacteroidales bacterium]|nr:FAD:protein FMN transferase [Bacteroidales bacterium]